MMTAPTFGTMQIENLVECVAAADLRARLLRRARLPIVEPHLARRVVGAALFMNYSSSGAPPPDFATSSCFTRSTLNFCALPMILSSVSSKSNDVAFEKRV